MGTAAVYSLFLLNMKVELLSSLLYDDQLSFLLAVIAHPVVAKGSLAISLPSINFHSDAEIDDLPPGEDEPAGLKR